MNQDQLREVTAATQHELELARAGDGYEEKAVAEEIVDKLVAPLLADLEAKLAGAQLDILERGKSIDRLTWLHAEAVWKVGQQEALTWEAESDFASAMNEINRAEEDVDRLRLENRRLRREVEFEANGENLHVVFGFGPAKRPCACLTPEGAAQVAAQPKWTLPQCSVHPDRGGNDD